jgi:uncharacterized membrane protein YqjE
MASTDRPEGVDLSREPKAPELSLGELFSEMTSNLSTLMRQEVELAKVETKEEVARAGKAAGMLGGAAVAGHMALLLASFALAWLLDEWLHTALAFLVVAVIYGIVAAVLYSQGRQRLKQMQGMPNTTQSLKEDVEWARAQRS